MKTIVRVMLLGLLFFLLSGSLCENPKDPHHLIVDLYCDPGDDFDLEIHDSNGQQIAESSNVGTHDQTSVWIDPGDYVTVYVYEYSGSGPYNLYFSGDYDDSRSGYLNYGDIIHYQVNW